MREPPAKWERFFFSNVALTLQDGDAIVAFSVRACRFVDLATGGLLGSVSFRATLTMLTR